MIKLQQLRLTNQLLFRRFSWRLDQRPLTVITGRNLDQNSQSANAVGKSLLCAAMANLLLNEPPLAVRRNSAKELVFDHASTRLQLHSGQHAWQFTQFADGKSVKYKIKQDGKSLNVRRQPRKLINQAFPLTADQFYSQVYISSYRPSILWLGSPARRADFFEQVFELQIFDLLRHHTLQRLQQVHTKSGQAKLLQQQRGELLPRTQRDYQQHLQHTQQQQRDLLRQYKQLTESTQKLVGQVALAQQLYHADTADKLQQLLVITQRKLRQADAKHQQLQRKFGAIQAAKRLRRLRQRLQTKLAQQQRRYRQLPTVKQLQQQLHQCQRLLQRQQRQLRDYLRLESHIQRYRQQIQQLSATQLQQPVTTPQLDAAVIKVTQLELTLKQRQKLRAGQPCPLCQQLVAHDHSQQLQELQQQLQQRQQKLTRARQINYCQKIQDKIPAKLLALSPNKIQRQLRRLRQQLIVLQQQLQQAQIRQRWQQQLQQLPTTTISSKINRQQLQKAEQLVAKLQQRQQHYQHDLRLLAKLADSHYDGDLPAAEELLAKQKTLLQKLAPRLRQINDKLQQLSSQQADYLAASQQLVKIDQQLTELQGIIADREILEVLAKAYSAKGMRVLQLQTIAAAYSQRLNELSSSLYPQRVKFYSQVDQNEFSILAERGNRIADVRSFSGSESRMFLVLSALALISLMPERLRVNCLIMDELEAGMATANRHIFAQEFVPMISRSVPHTILITPLSDTELPIPNAVWQTLVRKNNITQWER